MIREFRKHINEKAWLICPWGDKGAFASDAEKTYSRFEGSNLSS